MKMKTSKEKVTEIRPRVKGRGGVGAKGTKDPCLFTFKEKLKVQSERVFEGLHDEMQLAVVRRKDKVFIVDKGMIVGLISKNVQKVINCMTGGYTYEATVLSKGRDSQGHLVIEVLIEGFKRG